MRQCIFLLITTLIISFKGHGQTIVYVDIDAAGSNNGTSWANAYTDLQAAIDAGALTTPAQVWIKAGTYYPTATTDRTVSFVMKNDVEIYGGFAGSETSLSQRDWKSNETILSGDIGVLGNKNDNTNNVIHNNFTPAAPLTASAILDGIVVERGYSNNCCSPNWNGGGGLRNTNASPIIRNCTFRNNETLGGFGGAIFNTGESNPIILGCVFYENMSSSWGGAVAYRPESDINFSHNVASTIANCLFFDNTSGSLGGAIYVLNYLVNIYNNTITENTANNLGGAGIGYVKAGSTAINNALYTNNIVWGNTAINSPAGEGQIRLINPGPVFTSNVVEGGLSGTSSFNFDPGFTDAVNNDFSLDYCNSPALDIGSTTNLPAFLTTDIDQNTRVFNGLIDIGAYESQVAKPFFSAIESTNVSCYGAADGVIACNGGGGSVTLSYSIDGVNFTSNSVFSGLDAGTYNLSVKDINDCTVTSQIEIEQPTELILGTTSDNISCHGANDGSIIVTASGSSGVYQYQINSEAFQASNSFTGLGAGDYTITVRDQGTPSCMVSTTTISITEPLEISASITTANVTCNGEDDGQINFTASGGTGTVQASIDAVNFQATNFTNLAPGSYSVTFMDENVCTTTASSVEIEEPSALVLVTSEVHGILCPGDASGEIITSFSGGTAPLEYSIDGDNFTGDSNFLDLVGGNYDVIARDANGCVLTQSFTISEPEAFNLNSSLTHISCNGETDGTISLNPTGGSGNYEYSIDGTNFNSTSNFTDLQGDTYTITLLDSAGCTYSEQFDISEPDELTLSASFDGSHINLTTQGGTSPYSYSVDGTNFQSEASFQLGNGEYTFTVKDANGCEAVTDEGILITAIDPLILNEIGIYPNPVTDAITLSNMKDIEQIRVLDYSGRLIITESIHTDNYRLNVSGLKNGVYFLALTGKEGIFMFHRFMKSN